LAKYNADSIKVLNDVESIRFSPGMFIGSTSTPTHLIEEVLDNSLDECLSGFANIVTVEIDSKSNLFSISDNGRGIPTEKDIPITISTVLYSGSKFKGSRDIYKICSGRHGVGLVAINALSDFFQIEIIKEELKCYVYTFEKYNLINKYSIKISDRPFSTKISFIPDKEIFESLEPDIKKIRHRLLISSIHLPECVFILIIDGEEEIIKLSIDDYFNQYCLNEDDEITDIIDFNVQDKDEYLNVKLCYSLNGSVTPKILSSVNLLPIYGGIHIKLLTDIIKDIFSSYGKKDNRFIPQDVLVGLRVYIDLSLTEPEFGSQTKTQLINRSSYLNGLFNKLKKLLDNYFSENKEQLDLILNRFIEYRRKIDSKNIKSKSRRRTSVKYTKLRDCKEDLAGELYIVEGDSAAGSLIQARDIKKHAIFPLKGKIPNVVLKKMEILKNKEVQELLSVIGTSIGSDFDIEKLRYDKIISVCDADSDGNHIVCLIIAMFAYLVPEIIKQKKLFICETPLFAINKGGMFIPIWTQKELEDARNGKNSNCILRIKGIGELNPWQAKICIFDNNRKLIPIKYTKDLDKILKLFSNSEEKRNLLSGDY